MALLRKSFGIPMKYHQQSKDGPEPTHLHPDPIYTTVQVYGAFNQLAVKPTTVRAGSAENEK